ncbi:MAG: hypothetical protein ISR65_02955 [Bacteriovoracaceae bacterium]|nr:hypothetical protein [Bacteriovoracaceae bacterium]
MEQIIYKYSKYIWVLIFSMFLLYNLYYFATSKDVIFLCKLTLNGLLVASFIAQREASTTLTSNKALVTTFVPVIIPPLMLTDGILINEKYSLVLITIGLIFSALAVIELWESFGVLPSLRTLKFGGPYRIVRHPIYFGYFMSSLGILFLSFSITNIVLFTLFIIFSFLRINMEEELLTNEYSYRKYKEQVKYRMLPCIY